MSTSLPSVPQMGKLYDTMTEKGVTGEILQNELLGLGRISDLSEAAARGTIPDRDSFRKFLNLGLLLPDPIILVVDYGQDLEAMIADGKYDYRNDDITPKRFPIEGKGKVEFEAKPFHFNRDISSDEAERLIKADDPANPWNPGKIEHILSFGKKFPDEQRKYPIVGLGSVAEVLGSRFVPCLDGDDSGRHLYLRWGGGGWDALCRFLAVRKKVSASRA